jgi:hypothetical protein
VSDRVFQKFLNQHGFVRCPLFSVPDTGMSSRVDAYESDGILLKVIVDRGQKFIELGRVGSADTAEIFALVAGVAPEVSVKRGSFSEAIKILNRYWAAIRAAILSSGT